MWALQKFYYLCHRKNFTIYCDEWDLVNARTVDFQVNRAVAWFPMICGIKVILQHWHMVWYCGERIAISACVLYFSKRRCFSSGDVFKIRFCVGRKTSDPKKSGE